jgi:hypothetical protein
MGTISGRPGQFRTTQKLGKPSRLEAGAPYAWLVRVTFVAGAVMVAVGLQDPNEIVFAVPSAVPTGLTLWMVELVLSIGLMEFTVSAWRPKWLHPARPRAAHAGMPRNARGSSLAPSLESAGLEVLTGSDVARMGYNR